MARAGPPPSGASARPAAPQGGAARRLGAAVQGPLAAAAVLASATLGLGPAPPAPAGAASAAPPVAVSGRSGAPVAVAEQQRQQQGGRASGGGLDVRLAEDPRVRAVQRSMVHAWALARANFVDPDKVAGRGWEDSLQRSLNAVYSAGSDVDAANSTVDSMLAQLGDPYTHFLPSPAFSKFKMSNEGELQGVGMVIAQRADAAGGADRLVVQGSLAGSPAERAGIRAGDEVTQIAGRPAAGLPVEEAASALRGKKGTAVAVQVRRQEDGPDHHVRLETVRLQRDTVQVSPLFSAELPHGKSGGKTGYLRLVQFTENAPPEVGAALARMEGDGVDSYILDLRDNPGGLVDSSAEIASMFLQPHSRILQTSGRADDAGAVLVTNSEPLTGRKLVVLVNGNSASASEILSGALRDNHRAKIVGDRTYGKGKIQSVFELEDGSGVVITVARYLTPAGHEIDQKGLTPDRSCRLGRQRASGPDGAGPLADELTLVLESDSCIRTAEDMLEL